MNHNEKDKLLTFTQIFFKAHKGLFFDLAEALLLAATDCGDR